MMPFEHEVRLSAIELYPIHSQHGNSPNMVLGAMPVRHALLLKLIDTQGCFGWGEVWCNFPPRSNLHKAHVIEDVFNKHIVKATFVHPTEWVARLRDKLSVYFLHIGQLQVFEHILAGLDTAAWDLCLRSAGQSFASFCSIEPSAQCYASSINADDLERRLNKHQSYGQSEFKLKIGFDMDADKHFVIKAAKKIHQGSSLMIDSNQAWDLQTAINMLQELQELPLLFAEECIRADRPLTEWQTLAESSVTALAAGENLYGEEQFMAMANVGVRFLQPDVSKWGGISGALALAKSLPRDCKIWPHFMGSAVGQQASLAISAFIGLTSKCEMDVNENKLRTDLCLTSMPIIDGKVTLTNEPGLVMPPCDHHINQYRL